jgi:hypothetical protein
MMACIRMGDYRYVIEYVEQFLSPSLRLRLREAIS